MFRVNEDSVKFLPKIPAQPIGYAEALVLLQFVDRLRRSMNER